MAIDSLSFNSASMVKPMNSNGLSSAAMADRFSGAEVSAPQAERAPLLGASNGSIATSSQAQAKTESSPSLDSNSVQRLNESLQKAGSNILFQPDEESGKMLFLMKDAETGETIRQIPNEVVLKISQAIGDFLKQAQPDGKSSAGASLPSALSGLVTNLMA